MQNNNPFQCVVELGGLEPPTKRLSAHSGRWVFAFSMQAEQSIVVDPKSPGGVDSPHGLILFDGVCVLCSRGCGFVSKRDRRGYFRFVPMQLAEGRPLAGQLGINPDRPDSFAFVANGASCEVYCLSNVESCGSEVSVGSQTVHPESRSRHHLARLLVLDVGYFAICDRLQPLAVGHFLEG